jgi:hypothetical protein
VNDALQKSLDAALRPLFGDNLPTYYTEVERYDAETRELIDRHLPVTQKLVDVAVDRLTFFDEDRRALLGAASENTRAQREAADRELHEALVAARNRHKQRVNALLVNAQDDTANGPSTM